MKIRHAITYIQEQSFNKIGLTSYELTDFFNNERQRLEAYLKDKPLFMRSKEDVVAADPRLGFIETELPKRYDIKIEGLPYQHPYYFSWLQDHLRYLLELQEKESFSTHPLIVATAPTGRFNAIALPGVDENGIVVEDGLVKIASNFSAIAAKILYIKTEHGQYLERLYEEIEEDISVTPLIDQLSEAIYSYVIDGYAYLPETEYTSFQQDFSIRHVLFFGLVSFVLEHENFHLKCWNKKLQLPGLDVYKTKQQGLWNFFQSHINESLPEQLTEQQFNSIYESHQEELLADFFAFCEIKNIGIKENTVSASIKGALLFFVIAGLIEYLLFKLQDEKFSNEMYGLSDLVLSLTAIATKESHPYAHVRQKGLLDMLRQNDTAIADLTEQEIKKLSWISNRVRAVLDEKVKAAEQPLCPHPKWLQDE